MLHKKKQKVGKRFYSKFQTGNSGKSYPIESKKWEKRSYSKFQNGNGRKVLLNSNQKVGPNGVTQSFKIEVVERYYLIQTKKYEQKGY